MVPEETEETTDCLPKPQSKSAITQLDSPLMVAPDEDVNSRIPEMSQSLAEAVSTELPLNVEEPLVREENNDVDTILNQVILEEFAFPFPDPTYTLDIQVSNSDQVTDSLSSSSVLIRNITSAAESSSVNHSNVLHGGSTTNTSAGTSLPSNPMAQNPQIHLPWISDPYEYELEKLRREKENVKKNFEEKTSELMADLERKMAEARSEFEREFQELDDAYIAKAMEEEANRSLVDMSSLLANAFTCKCTDPEVVTYKGTSSGHSIQQQQQQAVQTNAHMDPTAPPQPSVTAAEAQIPNPSGPLLHFPHHNTTQPRPVSQQAVAQRNAHVNSTAPPQPSVSAAEGPVPDPSSPLLRFPHCTTTQPTPISQQLNSTAPPPPSVTTAETRIPNPSGPPLHSPRYTMTQPRLVSQEAVAQTNTHMNSTAPPRPSVASAEAQIPNPSGPLLHSPHYTSTQPRPISQQMNSTALPRPSVTAAAETQIPNPAGPLLHFLRYTTTEPRPVSQEAVAQTNTHMNSTAPPRPSVTAAAETQIPNPPGPLLHSPRYDTTQPRPVSQRCNTPQPRPPPVISNHTPSSYAAVSFPPVHSTVRAPAPHLQRFRGPRAPSPAAAASRRLVQRQQQ